MKNHTEAVVINSGGHHAKVEEFDPATMVLATLTPEMKATPEQVAMLEEASHYDIVYEDDCPELSPSMIEAFRRAAQVRDAQRKVG